MASASRVFSPPDRTPAGLSTSSPVRQERAEDLAELDVEDVGPGRAHVLQDGAVRVEGLVFLGVVADLEAVAGADLAGVGLLDAAQDAQQGGLPGAVEAQDDDPVAPVDGGVDVGEDLQRAVGLRQVDGGQRVRPQGAGAGSAAWRPCRSAARARCRAAGARPGAACPGRPWPWWPWPASCRPAPSARRPASRRWPARACGASRRSRAGAGSSSTRRCRCRSPHRLASRWSTRFTVASSRPTSWLMMIKPPWWERKKSRSQPIESASRWFVGSSRRRVSDPEKRMRASSTRRR